MSDKPSPAIDRMASVQLQRAPQTQIETQLKEVFNRRVEERRARHADSDQGDQHRVYIEMGKDLVGMTVAQGNKNIDELYQRFQWLGNDVGYLMETFGDKGLVDESFLWLGRMIPNPQNPAEEIFEPAKHLLEVAPVISELTPQEQLGCYVRFLKGQVEFSQRNAVYGKAFTPNAVSAK